MTITPNTPGLPAGLLPPGAIVAHAGPATSIPAGWLLCDGSNVPRGTYRSLFRVIGTQYGPGDGLTTFGLPNFNDRYPYGGNTGSFGNGSNTHNHANQSTNVNLALATSGADSHTHTNMNINNNYGAGGVGSHNHNLNLGWNTGNANGIGKATGTTGVQGTAHDHNVSAGWNSIADSHTHNAGMLSATTNAGGLGNHDHYTNTNLNAAVTQGTVSINSTANHELNNFQTLFLIKT